MLMYMRRIFSFLSIILWPRHVYRFVVFDANMRVVRAFSYSPHNERHFVKCQGHCLLLGGVMFCFGKIFPNDDVEKIMK